MTEVWEQTRSGTPPVGCRPKSTGGPISAWYLGDVKAAFLISSLAVSWPFLFLDNVMMLWSMSPFPLPFPRPVHEHKHPLLLIGWNCVVWFRSEPLCLFPIYRARAVYEHRIFFSPHRAQTASWPWGYISYIWLKVYWIRIAHCTFNNIDDITPELDNYTLSCENIRRNPHNLAQKMFGEL